MAKTREVLDTLRLNFNMRQVPITALDAFEPVDGIVQAFQKAKADADTNRHLTAEGKLAARTKARDDAKKAIDAWRSARLAGLDADLGAQRAALMPTTEKPSDRRIDFMLSHLHDRTPEEIAVFYSSATDDERRTLEAAAASVGRVPRKGANGLTWEPLLDSASVNESILARARAANPAAVQKLEEVSVLRDMTATIANVALSELQE